MPFKFDPQQRQTNDAVEVFKVFEDSNVQSTVYGKAEIKEGSKKTTENVVLQQTNIDRQLQSTPCYPFFLLAKPLTDKEYTVTDVLHVFEIEDPWIAYPNHCRIEYFFSIEEKSYTGADIDYEEYIQQDWRTGALEIQADDLELLVSPANKSKQYIISIQGQIGTSFPISARKEMTLTVHNPCYDDDFVRIDPVESTKLDKDYKLFDDVRIEYVNPFKVVTSPLENHDLCGNLLHKAYLDDKKLSRISQPMAFDEGSMRIIMYSEDRDDVGMRKITIRASFVNYPELKFDEGFQLFNVNDNPCAFNELKMLKPGPLQNVTTFFNVKSTTQNFIGDDFVKRTDYEHDCGGLVVEFTMSDDSPIPEKIFNANQTSLTVKKQPYQAETRGGYMLKPTVYLAEWPRGAVTMEDSRYWIFVIIKDPCIDLEIRQRPTLCLTQNHISGAIPNWMRQLSDQYIALGENYIYEMGRPVDTFNRPVEVIVTLRRAESFMSYRFDNSLVIDGSKMSDSTTAYYQVTIEILYEDIFGILQYFKKHIQFIVVHLAIPKVNAEHKLYFMHDENLPFYFDHEARSIDDQIGGDSRPEPFFIGLTEFGKIKIGWSQPIEPIADLNNLQEKKIALIIESVDIGKEFQNWAWITDRNASNGIRKYELKPAVEIVYQNQKSNKAKDEVKIISTVVESIDEQTMDIQAVFENPNSVGQSDKLLVIFWRNDQFSKVENGQKVRFETSVITPIFRQVDREMAEYLDKIASYVIIFSILVALFGIILAMFHGNFQTYWVFLNAMQLVIYTVLIQFPMPSNASYFMGQLLNLLRLQLYELLPFAQETSSSLLRKLNPTASEAEYYQQMNQSDQSSILILLQSLRYYPSLFKNLSSLIYLLFLMLLIWLTLCFGQLICKRKLHFLRKQNKCSLLVPQSLNCLARFCYEGFLEISICCLLSLSLASQTYDFFSALVLTWFMIISVMLILVLFYKGGPYLRKGAQGYEKRTLWNSFYCWQARKVTIDVERLTELRRIEILEAEKEQQLLDFELGVGREGQTGSRNHRQNLLNLRAMDGNEGDKNNFVQTQTILQNEQGTHDEIYPDDDMNTDRYLLPRLIGDRPQDEHQEDEFEPSSPPSANHLKQQQNVIDLEIVEEQAQEEMENSISLINQQQQQNSSQDRIGEEAVQKVNQIFEGGQLTSQASVYNQRLKLVPGERKRVKLEKKAKSRHEVRRKLMLEDLVTVKPEFKTLFSGLKLGHPENVAIVHPLVFLIRRIFFSIGIIFLGHYGVVTLSILQLSCLFSLCYSIEYRQWNSALLNMQHLTNEGLLYIILSLELCITAHEEMRFKQKLGEALIALIIIAFTFNMVICLYSSMAYLRLLHKRVYQSVRPTKERFNISNRVIKSLTSIYTRKSTTKSLSAANSASADSYTSSYENAPKLEAKKLKLKHPNKLPVGRYQQEEMGVGPSELGDRPPLSPESKYGIVDEVDCNGSRPNMMIEDQSPLYREKIDDNSPNKLLDAPSQSHLDLLASQIVLKKIPLNTAIIDAQIKSQQQPQHLVVKQPSDRKLNASRSRNVGDGEDQQPAVSSKRGSKNKKARKANEQNKSNSNQRPEEAGGATNTRQSQQSLAEQRNNVSDSQNSQDNYQTRKQRLGSYIIRTRKNTIQVINELLKETPGKQSEISKATPVRQSEDSSMQTPFRVSEEVAEMEKARLKLIPELSGNKEQENSTADKGRESQEGSSRCSLNKHLSSFKNADESTRAAIFVSSSKGGMGGGANTSNIGFSDALIDRRNESQVVYGISMLQQHRRKLLENQGSAEAKETNQQAKGGKDTIINAADDPQNVQKSGRDSSSSIIHVTPAPQPRIDKQIGIANGNCKEGPKEMTPLEIIAQMEAEAAQEESAKHQLDVLEEKAAGNQALPTTLQRNQDRNCYNGGGAHQSLNDLVQNDDLNTKSEDFGESDQRFYQNHKNEACFTELTKNSINILKGQTTTMMLEEKAALQNRNPASSICESSSSMKPQFITDKQRPAQKSVEQSDDDSVIEENDQDLEHIISEDSSEGQRSEKENNDSQNNAYESYLQDIIRAEHKNPGKKEFKADDKDIVSPINFIGQSSPNTNSKNIDYARASAIINSMQSKNTDIVDENKNKSDQVLSEHSKKAMSKEGNISHRVVNEQISFVNEYIKNSNQSHVQEPAQKSRKYDRRHSKNSRMFSSRPDVATKMKHNIFAKGFGVPMVPIMQQTLIDQKNNDHSSSKTSLLRIKSNLAQETASFLKHPYAVEGGVGSSSITPLTKKPNQRSEKRSHSQSIRLEGTGVQKLKKRRISQKSASFVSAERAGEKTQINQRPTQQIILTGNSVGNSQASSDMDYPNYQQTQEYQQQPPAQINNNNVMRETFYKVNHQMNKAAAGDRDSSMNRSSISSGLNQKLSIGSSSDSSGGGRISLYGGQIMTKPSSNIK